jgi:hypothetical protein
MGTIAKSSSGQVTWNGHLLYTWTGDKSPGDVTGNGINNFAAAVVTASSGSAGAGTTPPASSSSSSSGGGYGY